MSSILSKDEMLELLKKLYNLALTEEKQEKIWLVSNEIYKLIIALSTKSKYYKFPDEKTIETISNKLSEFASSPDFLSMVFKSKEICMINELNSVKILKSFGEEMEQLYYDDDYIIGIHGTVTKDFIIRNEIFTKGLKSNHGPTISKTILTKENGLDFYSFLKYNYIDNYDVNAVIIRIPKDDLNKEVWFEKESTFYLNPKYIYGYYLSHFSTTDNKNPIIVKNPNYGKDNNIYNIRDSDYINKVY